MLTFAKFVDSFVVKLFSSILLPWLILISQSYGYDLYEGSSCELKEGNFGVCVKLTECTSVLNDLQSGKIDFNDLVHCSFVGTVEVICCKDRTPVRFNTVSTSTQNPHQIIFIDNNNDIFKKSSEFNSNPTPESRIGRKAVIACEQYSALVDGPPLTFHILDGTPAAPGEFPHMAALGYPSINGDEIGWNCGGSLISDRYVLTAAHCLTRNSPRVSVIRLGTISLSGGVPSDSEPVEVGISNTFLHPNYNASQRYNDIALIQLDKAIKFNDYVRPACLNTNLLDPNPNERLIATGWGIVSIKTRNKSDILSQVNLTSVSLESCNQSYVNYGLNRRYPFGLDGGQMCAYDPESSKDACEGDSGGPLQVKNKDIYTIYGVTSFGISCGSKIPGVYARVAYYLDWIESIVW